MLNSALGWSIRERGYSGIFKRAALYLKIGDFVPLLNAKIKTRIPLCNLAANGCRTFKNTASAKELRGGLVGCLRVHINKDLCSVGAKLFYGNKIILCLARFTDRLLKIDGCTLYQQLAATACILDMGNHPLAIQFTFRNKAVRTR